MFLQKMSLFRDKIKNIFKVCHNDAAPTLHRADANHHIKNAFCAIQLPLGHHWGTAIIQTRWNLNEMSVKKCQH